MATIVFYCTLGYNLARNYIQPSSFRWYDRIDDNIIVGAIPFSSMVEELKTSENVGGVVSCNEEFELQALKKIARRKDWEDADVAYYNIPIRDFVGSASNKDIAEAIKFMEQINSSGKTVYLHCKAGQTRSASIAACYLMKRLSLTTDVACHTVRSKRIRAHIGANQWRMLNYWRKYLDSKNNE